MRPSGPLLQHPLCTRRTALQAGAVGLLGLAANHVAVLRSTAGTDDRVRADKARNVIYIFLSGGLSQIDSFDPKPDAPADIRGDFATIATRTTGLRMCEHLPRLAQRSRLWSIVRSLTHPTNDHSAGHLMMLSGRSVLPAGFNASTPRPSDWPSIAAVAGTMTRPRNNLPPAAVLPERLVHNSGRVIPGQFAGIMGPRRDPWFIEASPFDPLAYGAYPEYEFDHQQRPQSANKKKHFQAPSLSLPEGLGPGRLGGRLGLLKCIDDQRRDLEAARWARVSITIVRRPYRCLRSRASARRSMSPARTRAPRIATAPTPSAGRC